MKAPPLAVITLVSVACGTFSACNSNPAVRLETVEATRADVAAVLTTNGRIEAGSRYDVHSETTGRVERTPVQAGDTVERGEPVAVVNDPASREALEAAEARLAASRAEMAALEAGLPHAERAELESRAAQLEADLRAHQVELQQAERLAEKEAIPDVERQAAARRVERIREEIELVRRKLKAKPLGADLDRARARIREAEAAVSAAAKKVRSATVRAPIAGVVYSLAVEPGMFVAPGTLVARIAGAEAPRARLLIDEPELGKVRLGAEAMLTADAFPEESWICRIDSLPTEVLEVGTRRVGEARCSVDPAASKGPVKRLIPNLTVDVSIAVARAEGVISLPRNSVMQQEDQDYVWIPDEGLARRQEVTVGLRGGGYVEIRSGLALGDRVLLPGNVTLDDGSPVTTDEPD